MGRAGKGVTEEGRRLPGGAGEQCPAMGSGGLGTDGIADSHLIGQKE